VRSLEKGCGITMESQKSQECKTKEQNGEDRPHWEANECHVFNKVIDTNASMYISQLSMSKFMNTF
jgi:hypothetical protein